MCIVQHVNDLIYYHPSAQFNHDYLSNVLLTRNAFKIYLQDIPTISTYKIYLQDIGLHI